MFEEKYFDDEDFEHFDTHIQQLGMSFQTTALYIGGIVLLVILLLVCCYRCCKSGQRGRILTPAPAQVQVQSPAPYPQQQYNVPYPAQVVTTYPVSGAAYPAPSGYPYPPQGMPVANHPHPGPLAAPYPAAQYPAAPYPTASYPSAPSAPDPNAVPPSYDQAVCGKPPPHNPYASH